MPSPLSDQLNIGTTLARLRADAKVSQKDVAGKMRVDQSRISRIENGEAEPTSAEVKIYLTALGTAEASAHLTYLQKNWQILERPPITNPDLEGIWRAEKNLQKLHAFEADRNPPAAVRGELQMHRESLLDAARFLTRTDHDIAFVGQAGVGKTTAVSLVSDLVLSDPSLPLDKRLLLETGKGRITLCEIRVRTGKGWGLQIDPTPEAEIYRLVSELCANSYGEGPLENGEEKGIPRELDRALRNMAGLPRSVKKIEGKSVIHDPLVQVRATFKSVDELASEFASRLRLWRRTTRELWCPKNEKDERKWLRDTFAKLNKGQLEDVSLPARIDVLVPHGVLNQISFDLTLIDTRGVDETVVRPDLRSRITDARTLTVLCSEFKAAPDNSVKQVLKNLLDSGGDRAVGERVTLLVLPHPGDAQGVTDDSGQTVESDVDGYEIKRDQVTATLKSVGAASVHVLMFNAVADDPVILGQNFVELIRRLRSRYTERIDMLAKAVAHLFKNYEQHAAELVRADVNKRLRTFLKRHESLPQPRQQAHDFLLSQLVSVHASSVWATTRRQGAWYNLDVYHCLGFGAGTEAKRRSVQFFEGLEAIVTNMLDSTDLAAAHPFLDEVLVKVGEWKEAFLEAAHQAGAEAFRPALQAETALWAGAESVWGQGGGYRTDVAALFRNWFLAVDREGLHKALEKRIKAAWRLEVIERLQAICSDEAKPKEAAAMIDQSLLEASHGSSVVQ
jgi:transcriptional regulator with XRE-family HTH domain